MRFNRIGASVLTAMVGVGSMVSGMASSALAQSATPWQKGMQAAATPVAERMHEFHDLLLILISVIVAFVLCLLVYVMVRFNAKANPTPSRTTHNTVVEVIWTVVPIMILVTIAVPSFKLLYFMDRTVKPELTLKVTGHQWYWSYEYPDRGKIAFDSLMIPSDQLKPGQKRLLEVDNRVVVPVDTNVRVLITADDVLHSWAVPAFGVKTDAVPGRLNETWFRVTRPGLYYGQCSELCGVNHGFMPIAVEAVSKADFDKWVAAKTKAAALPAPASPVTLAHRAAPSAGAN